jgi:3',5'-cyclic-AMP phosphodiesterase
MPVHLPAISRRNFLGRSLAAGAGMLLAPSLLSAKPSDRNTFAFLADVHIAADPKQLGRGMNMTDHLRSVVDQIRALDTAPAAVVIHGDCAISTGKRGDYTQLLKLLQPLRESHLPIHLALGNHDNLEHFLEIAQPKIPTLVHDKYVTRLDARYANFFILDSLNGNPPSTPSNPGLLGQAQREWLGAQLKEHRNKPAVVIVHHTPAAMQDWKQLLALLDDQKHVKGMFYGHRHTWGISETPGGVHLINLLPTSYPSPEKPDLGPDAGAVGWTAATFSRDRVKLRVHCLNTDHRLHDSVHELKWRKG